MKTGGLTDTSTIVSLIDQMKQNAIEIKTRNVRFCQKQNEPNRLAADNAKVEPFPIIQMFCFISVQAFYKLRSTVLVITLF